MKFCGCRGARGCHPLPRTYHAVIVFRRSRESCPSPVAHGFVVCLLARSRACLLATACLSRFIKHWRGSVLLPCKGASSASSTRLSSFSLDTTTHRQPLSSRLSALTVTPVFCFIAGGCLGLEKPHRNKHATRRRQRTTSVWPGAGRRWASAATSTRRGWRTSSSWPRCRRRSLPWTRR